MQVDAPAVCIHLSPLRDRWTTIADYVESCCIAVWCTRVSLQQREMRVALYIAQLNVHKDVSVRTTHVCMQYKKQRPSKNSALLN